MYICTSVSSVSMDDVKPVESDDEMIRKLDKVSLRTLHELHAVCF